MQVSTRFVGMRSRPHSVSLSPRRAMNFAAALGDGNPAYFDDERPGALVAPPMIAVALTWPLSSDFDTYWGDSGFPADARMRQVHYSESLVWHRSLQADESLDIQGEIQAIMPHPSGALLTIRYDARGRSGERVFTEHITGLLRGVGLEEAEGRGTPPPAHPATETTAPAWTQALAIDPLAAHVYDGCTDIVFPIHTSAAFAHQVGLPRPIYHGTATLGLAAREIVNREAGGDPRALMALHAGFRGMVIPGSTILLRVLEVCVREGMKTVHFDVATPEGALAIRGGCAELRLAD